MVLKYIEAYVRGKNYLFTNKDIDFDKTKQSIILPKEYVENDIDNYSYIMNHLFNNDLLNGGKYSNYSNINRAIKNKNIEAILKITYCSDISRSDSMYSYLIDKTKSLNHVDRYCTGVQYQYNLRTKEIKRYEIYGDLILGDIIPREESYYDKYKGQELILGIPNTSLL